MNPKNKIWTTLILSSLGIFALGFLSSEKTTGESVEHTFWADKTHGKKKYDVVVFGDSRVYRGISTEEIESELIGLSVVNLGYSSGGFSEVGFDLIDKRLQLSENAVVVLGITPFSLTEKAAKNEHLKSQQAIDDFEVFKRLNWNPFLSFFEPYDLEKIWSDDADSGYVQQLHRGGWIASEMIPPAPESALASYQKQFKKEKVLDKYIIELEEQVNRWISNGVKVVCFRPPSSVKMEELENEMSGFNELSVRRRLEEKGAAWFECDSREYTSYDGSHLHHESARKLSRELGRFIGNLSE